MDITPISGVGGSRKLKGARPASGTPITLTPSTDKVEISTTSRRAVLDAIKSKMKSGFYSSDEVAEDLSEKFARLLDR